MTGKRYTQPAPSDRNMDRHAVVARLASLEAHHGKEVVDALPFVIGAEGSAVRNVEIEKARNAMSHFLSEIMGWATVEGLTLRSVRGVGLKRTENFGLQELRTFLEWIGSDGIELEEACLYMPDKLKKKWNARFKKTFPVVDGYDPKVFARSRKDFETLIASHAAFTSTLEVSSEKPQLWSFVLGRSIQREDLKSPSVEINTPVPGNGALKDPKVKARIERLVRLEKDGRILDMNIAQDLFGTGFTNRLRDAMRELKLQAANRGWNLGL